MKNITHSFKSILLGCFCLLLSTAFGQMEEGYIRYDFTYEALTDEAAEVLAFMPDSHYDFYFTPNNSAFHIEMGIYLNLTIVRDFKTEKIFMKKDLGGEKTAIKSTFTAYENYLKTEENDKEAADEEADITYLDETKTIKGYTCKKALITDEDGGEVIYWYTDELKVKGLEETAFDNGLSGTVMAFELENEGIKTTCMVSQIKNEIEDQSVFDMNVPEGYEEIKTFEEYLDEGEE